MNSALEPEVVTIPEGDFLMGSDVHRKNERPVHRVWLDAFSIASLPVTRAEYHCFLEASGRSVPSNWHDRRFGDAKQPVVSTTWFDAEAYCQWLSAKTGKTYRLPTEAEREKAARGGGGGLDYPWGNNLPDWMDPYCRGDDVEQPDIVGLGPANGYGLYNMGDLVHEWCADWYSPDYYFQSPEYNPTGPAIGVRRASRGGSWRHHLKVTRCAARSSIPPNRGFSDYGFRITLSLT